MTPVQAYLDVEVRLSGSCSAAYGGALTCSLLKRTGPLPLSCDPPAGSAPCNIFRARLPTSTTAWLSLTDSMRSDAPLQDWCRAS